ncbi:transcription factor ATOH8 [Bacillus rossius redtenbacheri]|uniref:transcription factor ATOH8 n=1 Tax=Bacillus rossius redtenbacheri TaxID=93214 RepID=UPI002FDD8403
MAAALEVTQHDMLPVREPSPLSKDSKTSTLERDAGFCSGGDDEDLEAEDDPHAHTDTSDDSVEAKAPASCASAKNKRKSAEPRRLPGETSPHKKRRRHLDARVPVPPLSDYSTASDTPPSNPRAASLSPFRPWSNPVPPPSPPPPPPPYTDRVPAFPQQDEPLSLVLRPAAARECPSRRPRRRFPDDLGDRIRLEPAPPPAVFPARPQPAFAHARPRPGPAETCTSASLAAAAAAGGGDSRPKFSVESLLEEPSTSSCSSSQQQQQQQRNYKNMTRERRIEANARERTRVHTISAAFDTLRRAVPAYSHNQKLSKLSVLRIACSYILTLSRVAGADYSGDGSAPSVASCVEQVSRTIQTEGKLRRKKDD